MNLRNNNGLEVDITGHDGAHWYSVTLRPIRENVFACDMVKVGETDGYTLFSSRGLLSCQCKAFQHRGRLGKKACKHCDALRELLDLLPVAAQAHESLSHEESEVPF